MKGSLKEVACTPECGFKVRSHDQKEIIDVVKKHARNAHHMKTSESEVKAMMKDA